MIEYNADAMCSQHGAATVAYQIKGTANRYRHRYEVRGVINNTRTALPSSPSFVASPSAVSLTLEPCPSLNSQTSSMGRGVVLPLRMRYVLTRSLSQCVTIEQSRLSSVHSFAPISMVQTFSAVSILGPESHSRVSQVTS